MPSLEEILAGASQAAAKSAGTREITLLSPAQTLDQQEIVPRTLVYGSSGSGKTHFLVGPLLMGERLLIREVDFGGTGLATLKTLLDPRFGNPACINRPDLLKNVYSLVLPTYEHFFRSLSDPLEFFPRLAPEHEEPFRPTVDVLEGISGFQAQQIDEEVYGDDLEDEDKWRGFRMVKRATLRAFYLFLRLQYPGHVPMYKIVTGLESGEQRIKDKKSGTEMVRKVVVTSEYQGKKGILLSGAAATLVEPSFDIIIETYIDDDVLGQREREHRYRCRLGPEALGKNRGYGLPETMTADPVLVWERITGRRR